MLLEATRTQGYINTVFQKSPVWLSLGRYHLSKWLCSAMKYILGRFQIKFLLPGAEGAGIGLVGAG